MSVRDRRDAGDRRVIGDEARQMTVEVVDRGGHVAGISNLDGVEEDLEAERVAAVVILVGRELGAGADREVPTHRVQALAVVQLPGDPGAFARGLRSHRG